jgi:hypothetical protein
VTIDADIPALILYSTSACHLCEQALELMQPLVAAGCEIRVVDISESDELFERYGILIPVLRRVASGAELNWPFDLEAIADLLEKKEA